MKIDTSQRILTLKGDPYKVQEEELTLGYVLAEVLANDTTGGKMKLWSLASRAYNGGEIEVDSADLTLIKSAVERSKVYNSNTIILGQTLEMLEAVK